MNWHKKKVLIAGGLGFIGSNLAIYLVAKHAIVTIVDSLIPECGGNIFNIDSIKDRVAVHRFDVRDKEFREIVKGQDVIFNLTGYLSHTGSQKNPSVDFELNVTSTLALLDACRDNNPKAKIIFTSTRGVYGSPEKVPVDESARISPVDPNGISKFSAEQYHLMYSKLFDMNISIIRLTNVFGPRHQMKDSSQGFFNWFIRLALENKEISVFDGKQLRDFNYIEDVVEALQLMAEHPETRGEIFNLGSGEGVSVGTCAEKITSIIGGSFQVIPYPDEKKKVEVGDYIADISKIKSIGWEPKTDFSDGIRKTAEFYNTYKDHYF